MIYTALNVRIIKKAELKAVVKPFECHIHVDAIALWATNLSSGRHCSGATIPHLLCCIPENKLNDKDGAPRI